MATRLARTPERVQVKESSAKGISQGEPVLLKSSLHKKGKRFKGWHQRYFEIQGTHMYYYKNSSKSDLLGEIDLTLCTFCGPANEATFGEPFEIRTKLRTHVMSARGTEERDQWISTIRQQSKVSAGTSKSKKEKPKRWKTFKNALRLRKSQDNLLSPSIPSTPSKRGNIFSRFRRQTSRPTLRETHTEAELNSNRPLSLIEDSVTMDRLELMLDATPSRSLPATPLTQRRPIPIEFPQTEDNTRVSTLMSLPTKLPTFSVSTAGEDSDDENAENNSAIELDPPPSGFRAETLSHDACGEQVRQNDDLSEPTSADAEPETPVSLFSSEGGALSPAPSEETNSAGRSKSVETDEMLNGSRPTSGELTEVPAIVCFPDKTELEPYVIQDKAWEEIRSLLTEEAVDSEKSSATLPVSGQNEPWRNLPSGIEGLRAFLDMSD